MTITRTNHFEIGFEIDLADVTDEQLNEIEDLEPNAAWHFFPRILINSSELPPTDIPQDPINTYPRRFSRFDFLLKKMFWREYQNDKNLPNSFFPLDLQPNIHWNPETWNPEFRRHAFSSFFHRHRDPSHVIPEIIRPYVDYINSVEEFRPILSKFSGVMNFEIYTQKFKEIEHKCHLIYSVDGSVELHPGVHSDPVLLLSGDYRIFAYLFHIGEKVNITEEGFQRYITWKTDDFFKHDYRHFEFQGELEAFKQWVSTLIELDLVSMKIHTDLNMDSPIHKVRVEFDSSMKLIVRVHFLQDDSPLGVKNYFPQSLYECNSLLHLAYDNLFAQRLKLYQ